MESYLILLNPEIVLPISDADYINECCEYCDVFLERLKIEFEKTFNVKEIEIGQEDWGWYLVFIKDGLTYNFHLTFNEIINGRFEFIFYSFVNKIEKKLFFKKRIELVEQTKIFDEQCKDLLIPFGSISLNT